VTGEPCAICNPTTDFDGADEDRAATGPANLDADAGGGTKHIIAAIQPQDDMGVEEQRLAHRAISAPLSASGVTSRTGAVRKDPMGSG
jgi:hypothetical protein